MLRFFLIQLLEIEIFEIWQQHFLLALTYTQFILHLVQRLMQTLVFHPPICNFTLWLSQQPFHLLFPQVFDIGNGSVALLKLPTAAIPGQLILLHGVIELALMTVVLLFEVFAVYLWQGVVGLLADGVEEWLKVLALVFVDYYQFSALIVHY